METRYAVSTNGKRIAYDMTGSGPALVLLHGLGWTRQDWHKTGYVDRLRDDFTVITVDFRGFGDSDKPLSPEDYAIRKQCDDVIAVAEACGAQDFAIWGYSYGGNISRYLAAWHERVNAIAVIGVPFGPAIHDYFAGSLKEFDEKWQPLVEAYHAEHSDKLSDEEEKAIAGGQIEIFLACMVAMHTWPVVDPGDVHCPAMLLVGDKNEGVMEWVREHRDALHAADTQVEIVAGLNHAEEFSEIDVVFPVLHRFFSDSMSA